MVRDAFLPWTERLHARLAPFRYWPRTWRIIWAAAPRQTALSLVVLMALGVLPVTTVYSIKLVVDSVVGANTSTSEPTTRTLLLLAVALALLLTTEVLQSILEWTRAAQSELVQDHIKSLIHQQAVSVDLAFYESSDFQDQLEQVRNEVAGRPLALLESAGSLLQGCVMLVAIAALLVPYGAWLPAVLVGSSLPALLVVARFDRRYHAWWRRTTSQRRWTQYYDGLLTHSAPAAELRLFGLGEYFCSRYQSIRRQLRKERLDLVSEQTRAKSIAGASGSLISCAVIVWMIWRVTLGLASLGDLVLLYQAFQRGQSLMRTLLGGVGQLYGNTLFLRHLFTFLDLETRVRTPAEGRPAPTALRDGIHFRNIDFAYAASERLALNGLDLFVPAGKIVAIVGPNGAGKTTLLKLLCRFYDPLRGSVELDGVDIRTFSLHTLRKRLTVLFQFPTFFMATVHDSIAMGDLESRPTQRSVEQAAFRAGTHELAQRLPHGYETLLGKWFDEGVELSGGEWQRIAMARAYLRQASIIVLDEPTSHLDSWAEAEWFRHFRGLADGRTGLVITHRFTIAMRADMIHVMDAGRVVESGTHAELVALGGLYAQSWKSQMEASSGLTSLGVLAESVA